MTSQAKQATKKPSEEVDKRQLELAKQAGQAYYEALQYMANEVADTGGETRAGDYIVAFAQEKAEGMYHFKKDQLVWEEPTDENCHFEVAVLDAADKRFIPYLDVRLTVSQDGDEVGSFDLPFLWHPGLFHYGLNVKLPGDGAYKLQVEVAPPTFMRHDKKNGDRYAKTVEATFENVQVTTGQG